MHTYLFLTRSVCLCWLLGTFIGCAATPPPPSLRVDQTAPAYPMPRAPDCNIDILTTPPTAPHQVFAQITIRGRQEQMASMQAKLKAEACARGADAVITSIDQSSTRIFHETTGVGGANAPAHLLVKDYPLSLIGKALVYNQ